MQTFIVYATLGFLKANVRAEVSSVLQSRLRFVDLFPLVMSVISFFVLTFCSCKA